MFPDEFVEGAVCHDPCEPSSARCLVGYDEVCCASGEMVGRGCAPDGAIQVRASESAADGYWASGVLAQGFEYLHAKVSEVASCLWVCDAVADASGNGCGGVFKLLDGEVWRKFHGG